MRVQSMITTTTRRTARRAAIAALAVGLAAPVAAAEAAAAPPPARSTGVVQTSDGDSPVFLREKAAVGHWTVASLDAGRYLVTWTSPRPLRVTDARPVIVSGTSLVGAPAGAVDRRSVSVVVASDSVPDPGTLDVDLSGKLLDEGTAAPTGPSAPYVRPTDLAPPAEDPGVPGSFTPETFNFGAEPEKLPGLPLKSEMREHVVQPDNADNTMPLVLFLHGRHSACYRPKPAKAPAHAAVPDPDTWSCRGHQRPIPSYLGYDYVQQVLASQGYVTTSISADAINDQDYRVSDGGAAARAVLIRKHLNLWADRVDSGEFHADLSNVILVGHSRGGEGVNRASLTIPASAPYQVTGQVLIGPTDFGFQTAPYIPTVTVLPYCDGDVSDLQGQIFTDNARDLVADDTALHSSILVMGANHNFFNTEWTPGLSVAPSNDDWYGDSTKTCDSGNAARLSPQGQQDVGTAYIAGAVHLFADDDQDVLSLFDGSATAVPSANDADVRSHAIGGGRETRRPKLDSSLSTGDASTQFCVGKADTEAPSACGAGVSSVRTPHWPGNYQRGVQRRPAFEMTWSAAGQTGGLTLDDPFDLSAASALDLRTIVSPGQPVQLSVRLSDADSSTVVIPEADGVLTPLPGGAYSLAKRWGQTLRVPLDGVTGVDLDAITGIDLVGVSGSGHVFVLDASSVPSAGVVTPPNAHVPTLNLGNVSVPEGDGPGTATVDVPFTVTGTLSADAEVTVVIDGKRPTDLTIPAGTTEGSVPITYRPDTTDDQRQRHSVVMFAQRNIETGRYIGLATVVDDDPSPVVTIRAESRRIVEGDVAAWTVSLSEPVDYYLTVVARPVAGGVKGPKLTVGDLTPRYRESHLYPIPPLDTPLAQTDVYDYNVVRPHRDSTRVTLPTLADRKDEGVRSVTMRFRVRGIELANDMITVYVRDKR